MRPASLAGFVYQPIGLVQAAVWVNATAPAPYLGRLSRSVEFRYEVSAVRTLGLPGIRVYLMPVSRVVVEVESVELPERAAATQRGISTWSTVRSS